MKVTRGARISEDARRARVELTIGTQRVETMISAAELDDVIARLAAIRATMRPEVPVAMPTRVSPVVEGGRITLTTSPAEPFFGLVVRHPGFGWLHFSSSARRLIRIGGTVRKAALESS